MRPQPRPNRAKPTLAAALATAQTAAKGRLNFLYSRPAPKLIMNPGPQHITPGQAIEIRGMVNRLARKNGKNYQRVWMHLQDRFLFTSYHLMPAAQFDEVRDYLQAWLVAPPTSEARKALLRTIHAQAEHLPGGINQIKRDFDMPSLRVRSDEELQELSNALRVSRGMK